MDAMEVDEPVCSNKQGILCWGRSACGELGVAGDDENNVRLPTAFPWPIERNNVTQIACGKQHSVFLLETGLVYTCGANDRKQLGRDGNESVPEVLVMLDNFTVIQVACGHYFTIALTADNHLYGFGANNKGQLGSDPCHSIRKPRILKGFGSNRIAHVACGAQHCLVLTSTGKIFSWGDNENGQLGLGSKSKPIQAPSEVKALSNLPIYMVATGGSHSFALTVSGTLFAWGKNSSGQLGLGDEKDRSIPTLVKSLRSKYVTYVCCGDDHTAVLTKFGRVFTFGCGKRGQLGHGGSGQESNPKQVMELTGDAVLQIACGSHHTLALVEGNGHVYSFGCNRHGQLGISERTPSQRTPVLVKGGWSSANGSNNTPAANRIFSGGNQNFVILQGGKNCPNRSYQRSMILDERTTYFLDETKVEQILRQANGDDEDEKKRAIDLIGTVFSSASCLNGSFLDPDTHETTGIKNHGLNVRPLFGESKEFVLQKIASNLRKSKALIEKIASSLGNLLKDLNGVPADLEALRVFLIINDVIPHSNVAQRIRLIGAFGEKILDQPKEVIKMLCTWWSILPQPLFLGLVRSFKLCVRTALDNFLTLPSRIEEMKLLQTALYVLNLLNKVNDEVNFMIPYQAFYMQVIKKNINITKDYLMFRQEMGAFTFCKFPFVFDAEAKSEILAAASQILMHHATEMTLEHNRHIMLEGHEGQLPSSPYLVFLIRRRYLVQDTLRHIDDIRKNYENSKGQFQKQLKIVFENEDGIDWGGPRKEFFLLLVEEIFDNKYGMFKTIEGSPNVWFNSQSFEDPEMYFLIGVICGLALYNSTIIDVHFPPVLYKKLLNQKTNFSDFRTFDPVYARTLEYLLHYPKIREEDTLDDVGEKVGSVKDTFCLNFQVEESQFGESIFIDLMENGGEKDVDEHNRQQYVDLLVDYYLHKSIKQQYEKFKEGFYSVCDQGFLMHFVRPIELMEMISGCEDYDDFMQIRENAEYKNGYHKDHPRILEFWEILENADLKLRKKFLAFLTGSDKIPIKGIKSIKIVISPIGEEGETLMLPKAATCFNHLMLPNYKEGIMRERLEFALKYFSKGFGLE